MKYSTKDIQGYKFKFVKKLQLRPSNNPEFCSFDPAVGVLKNKSGIYAFFEKNKSLLKKNEKIIYIGQTINLGKRIKQYAKPGPSQTTNKNINKYFNEIKDKKTISLYFFEYISLESYLIEREDPKLNEQLKKIES